MPLVRCRTIMRRKILSFRMAQEKANDAKLDKAVRDSAKEVYEQMERYRR